MHRKRTIIISNRLPIRIEREDGELKFIPSEGGLATGLGSIYQQKNNIWIGWPGIIPQNDVEARQITKRLAEWNLVPVFLTKEEIEEYYEGFSNEILWPVFHYRPSYANYENKNWLAYKKVNEKFCSVAIAQDIKLKEKIWIHDYQLMLLPQLLRNIFSEVTIGYFQHIPFPNDEVFRNIPWRDELLKGLLGADLIAFHTFNDTQHFLNSCSHILGLNIQKSHLHTQGRTIFIEVFPMGIDYDKFNSLSKTAEIRLRAKEIKDYYTNQKIILSIDRLDYSKGIIERLHGYESFLCEFPHLQEQVVLYMLVVPSRDKVSQYKLLLDEINRLVGHINATYGTNEWTPIAYFYNSYPIEELSALYLAADICLVTSIRDGMNLVCKEYIASKEDSEGILILSELAGASKELMEAIQVNPNSTEQIKEAIYQALQMSSAEKNRRMNACIEIVKKFNIRHWVRLFFNRLREIKTYQKQEIARRINISIKEDILKKYNAAKRRLFFLDYDGTLIGFQNDAEIARPTLALYSLLQMLKQDKKNEVVIISGRPHHTLEDWFGNMDYYLVAEHGAWTNYPSHTWKYTAELSTKWKIPVKHIMTKYSSNTPGAFIEEKTYSLAWHYRRAQMGLGILRAQELTETLRYLIPYHGLQLIMGEKVIEVKNSELNKGKAARDILSDYMPDFTFVMGDDTTDEDMFEELSNDAFTIKVGNNQSSAKYYVDNQIDAVQLLEYFADKRNRPKDEEITNSIHTEIR